MIHNGIHRESDVRKLRVISGYLMDIHFINYPHGGFCEGSMDVVACPGHHFNICQ